jgi:chromosome partitioning protein
MSKLESMVVAITNLKGGVGKTTIATNLAVSLTHRGYDVCIVDTDLGQQSSMEWSGNRSEDLKAIPVYGVTIKQLNKEVEGLKNRFDIVIVDGTPQLSELADRTILASDLLLIPLTPSIYDYRGFENFLTRFQQVKEVREASGASIEAYVVLNRVVPNTNVSKDIQNAIAEYEIGLLKTQLANRIAYVDTAAEGKGVIEYKDPKAKNEINLLTDEVLELAQKNAVFAQKTTA